MKESKQGRMADALALEMCIRDRPEAMTYYGDENSWEQLCERDDIDLVYVATEARRELERFFGKTIYPVSYTHLAWDYSETTLTGD